MRPIGTATSDRERLAIAIAVGAMGTVGFAVTSPILPDLADAFGVSRGSIGLVQAAVSIPGVMFSAYIGYLADRVGRRRVILAALLFFATFGVAGFFARSYWALVVVRFLQGIGTSGILGVGIVLIGDVFSGEGLRRAMGINITGITLMGITAPTVAGFVAEGGTFRPFLMFVVGYPLALWASRMPQDRPTGREAPRPLAHMAAAARNLRRAGKLTDFAGLLGVTLASVFVLHGLGLTVSPLFLEETFDVPVRLRGLIVGGFQFGVILVAARIATITGRFGVRITMTGAFALMSLGTTIATLAPGAWAVGLGLTVTGVGFGLYVPNAQTFASEAGGDVYRGLTILTWVTVVRIAQVIGPPTGSLIADGPGPRVAFGLAAVGMAALAVAWVPARAALNGRRRRS